MKYLNIKISLFINYFVFAALLNSVGLLIQKSQNSYGVSGVKASFLEPAKDLTIAMVAFLVGSFLPKLGFKTGMLLAYAVVFIGCLQMYFGNSFSNVMILFACTGFSFAIIKVSVLTMLGIITNTESRHKAFMGYIESVFMLGIVCAYIIFPLFYSDSNPNAWLRVYLILAGLIAIVFTFLFFSDFNFPPVENTSLKEDLVNMLRILVQPIMMLFAVFAFMYVMTEQGIMSWLPTFNQNVLHLNERLAAQMAVVLMLSIAFGRFISGFIVKRIHWHIYLTVCLLLAAAIILIVLPRAEGLNIAEVNSVTGIPVIGFVFPLIGLFLAPVYPIINSTILSATKKEEHSAVAGILTFFSALGGTSGSLILGYLFQELQSGKAFYFSLIPLTILMAIIYLIRKQTERKG